MEIFFAITLKKIETMKAFGRTERVKRKCYAKGTDANNVLKKSIELCIRESILRH